MARSLNTTGANGMPSNIANQLSKDQSGKAKKSNQKVSRATPISKKTTIQAKTNKMKLFMFETQEEERRFIHTYETEREAIYYQLWIEEIPKLEERIQVLEWFHDIYNPSEISMDDIEIEDEEEDEEE